MSTPGVELTPLMLLEPRLLPLRHLATTLKVLQKRALIHNSVLDDKVS